MSFPSAQLLTLRPDLADSFEQYDLEMSWQGFIAPKLLPFTPVASQAGNFGIIPIDQLLQDGDTARGPGGGYNRGTNTFKPSTYACKENGWEEPVDDREAQAYANYFSAELYAARRARDKVLRNLESRVCTALNSTTTFTQNGAVATSWKTIATATPVADVVTAIKTIRDNTGLYPNVVAMGWDTWQNLKQCTTIIDRIKYSGKDDPKSVTEAMVAALFGVEEVVVAGAQHNTARDGAAASIANLWDNDKVFVGRVARTGDFREACVGRVFHWTADGSSENGTVESYRDEPRRSNIIRVRMDTDEQVIYAAAGYLLTGANA